MQPFRKYSINIRGNLYEFDAPKVMAILNVTPDSFYSGSRCPDGDSIRRRVEQIVSEGADMVDIGGYSSRPGADDVPREEEFDRVARGMEAVREFAPDMVVSVDTFRASVARQCVQELGIHIINDISGGSLDENMFATVADLKVPYILMHMRGNPSTMQSLTQYDDVTADVIAELSHKVEALNELGVADVIIDPGFGFSKTAEQNYRMMRQLEAFHVFGMPLLVGISRKSMIYRPLGITPLESLPGTIALNMIALQNGAHILRVHDVKEAVQVVSIHKMLNNL